MDVDVYIVKYDPPLTWVTRTLRLGGAQLHYSQERWQSEIYH